MRKLVYKFQNPYNSCEEIHYCPGTKRYYTLMPSTPYSMKLCTCTPYHGFYEADCPVKAGLTFCINGKEVITEADGEIVDYAKKEAYENQERDFYQVKPEYADNPNYDMFSRNRIFPKLFDWMNPEHFDQITLKRKEIYCIMGGFYKEVKL